jgi:hypothetical protein
MMWDHITSTYRGQAGNGTVVVVESTAMDLAHKKAGKVVYDSDWWIETLQVTLEHWGVFGRYWMDAATRVPRANFSLDRYTDSGKLDADQVSSSSPPPTPTRPLSSGPLLNRIKSGPLGSRDEKR